MDDTLFFAKDSSKIDEVVQGLCALSMELEEDTDVAGFLGVHIKRLPDNTIKLTQVGLIKRIISALDIDHLPNKETPAKLGVLGADKDGEPPNGTYSYASVINMLGYLHINSRPDITYAVSQCARFTHNTRRSHEIAYRKESIPPSLD